MAKFRVLPYEYYVVLRGNTNAVAKVYGPGDVVEIADIKKDIQRAKLELVEDDSTEELDEVKPDEGVKEEPVSIAVEPVIQGDAKARAIEKLKGK